MLSEQVVLLPLVPIPFVNLTFLQSNFIRKPLNHVLIPIWIVLIHIKQKKVLISVLSESPLLIFMFAAIVMSDYLFYIMGRNFIFSEQMVYTVIQVIRSEETLDNYTIHGKELLLSLSVHHWCILRSTRAIVSWILILFRVTGVPVRVIRTFQRRAWKERLVRDDNIKVESFRLRSRIHLIHVGYTGVHPNHLWSRLKLEHLGRGQLYGRKNSFESICGCLMVMLSKCCVV